MTGPSHQGHHVWRHLRGMEVEAKIKKTPPKFCLGERRDMVGSQMVPLQNGYRVAGCRGLLLNLRALRHSRPSWSPSAARAKIPSNGLLLGITVAACQLFPSALSQVEVGHTEYGLGLQLKTTQFNHEQSQALPPCSLGHKHFTIAVELESCFKRHFSTNVRATFMAIPTPHASPSCW